MGIMKKVLIFAAILLGFLLVTIFSVQAESLPYGKRVDNYICLMRQNIDMTALSKQTDLDGQTFGQTHTYSGALVDTLASRKQSLTDILQKTNQCFGEGTNNNAQVTLQERIRDDIIENGREVVLNLYNMEERVTNLKEKANGSN